MNILPSRRLALRVLSKNQEKCSIYILTFIVFEAHETEYSNMMHGQHGPHV